MTVRAIVPTAAALLFALSAIAPVRAERLPLPAKGAKLVEAHALAKRDPVTVVPSQDYNTWLEWSEVPDTEVTFETRKAGVVDVRYIFTSDYNHEDGPDGPAGISIEVDGVRTHALESPTAGFSTDVDALPLGESYSLGPVLRQGGQFNLGSLTAIPAGRHTVRVVLRPSGGITRYAFGISSYASATRLRDQSLRILVYG